MKTFIILSSLALALVSCTKQETTAAPDPAESPAKPYPLETCLVSGEKLGSMGEPVAIVHDGQQIKFCCDNCVPKFRKEPDKYLLQLENE